MISDFKSRQFIYFLLASGFAAVVNFGSRFLYSEYLPFGAAVVAAYMTGMATAFLINKYFVFTKSRHKVRKELFYFTLVNLAGVLQTYLVSVGLAEYGFPALGFTWHPEPTAHMIGIAVPVVSSFLGHKYLSFKEHQND